ncbi:hypothetical protein DBR06_SOUSAS110167 [Sousa chinensis]|uniref:Uncharacterized protein n=1 Tax=Sousa chinensis TaxID=103600 RepID=A0A484GT01_SOUCH|nr:hypothetical protein DBR06_SOUSAS110167 [Sousa chinensis]
MSAIDLIFDPSKSFNMPCAFVHMFMFGVMWMRIPASLGVPPIRAESFPLELLGRDFWTAALQGTKVSGQTKLKCLQMAKQTPGPTLPEAGQKLDSRARCHGAGVGHRLGLILDWVPYFNGKFKKKN